MTSGEHDWFYKFRKIKPPVFHGVESRDAYEILIDYHECLL